MSNESRRPGSASRGIWWRSYTICLRQNRVTPNNIDFRTLPFSVVAAKSLAPGSALSDWSISNVVVHASGCEKVVSALSSGSLDSLIHTDRFLELFEKFMGLSLLRAVY